MPTVVDLDTPEGRATLRRAQETVVATFLGPAGATPDEQAEVTSALQEVLPFSRMHTINAIMAVSETRNMDLQDVMSAAVKWAIIPSKFRLVVGPGDTPDTPRMENFETQAIVAIITTSTGREWMIPIMAGVIGLPLGVLAPDAAAITQVEKVASQSEHGDIGHA